LQRPATATEKSGCGRRRPLSGRPSTSARELTPAKGSTSLAARSPLNSFGAAFAELQAAPLGRDQRAGSAAKWRNDANSKW